MKAYRLEVLVIDFDNVGDDIPNIIENTKYPNWCISPSIIQVESRDIGEWSDDHPLNKKDTVRAEYEKLFSGKSTQTNR